MRPLLHAADLLLEVAQAVQLTLSLLELLGQCPVLLEDILDRALLLSERSTIRGNTQILQARPHIVVGVRELQDEAL